MSGYSHEWNDTVISLFQYGVTTILKRNMNPSIYSVLPATMHILTTD